MASATGSWNPREAASPPARSASAVSPPSSGSWTRRSTRSAGARSGSPTPPTAPLASPTRTNPGRDADDLAGRHVVVTAGGTAEPIDPVRFIGNRSTGAMGFAVCEAARDRGARVTLVAGTVAAPIPAGVEVLRAETAADMQAALASLVLAPTGAAGFDALVMTAAVADFRPAVTAPRKIARTGAGLTLELRCQPGPARRAGPAGRRSRRDRCAERCADPPRPVLVGFAAETGGLERAAGKLRAKRVDLLVANDVSEPGSGFGTSTNRVTLFAADGGSEALPLLPKRIVAERILDRVAALLDARDVAAQTGATSATGGTAS